MARVYWAMATIVLALTSAPLALAQAQPDQACTRFESQAESALCAQEIAEEANPERKAELLYRRAYHNDEIQRYEAALPDLNAAVALVPNYALALRERAFTFNALGRYAEAESDLNAQAGVNGNELSFFQERAFARFFQGNLSGALADRVRAVELAPNDGASLLARADAYMWLGQWDAARDDIDAAGALARGADAVRAAVIARDALALWSTPTPNGDPHALCDMGRIAGASPPMNIVGDCTVWFLRAANGQERGDALTTRSVVLMLLDKQDDSVIDLQIAAALDPENGERHANLGQAYVRVRHSWAARNEFNRALAIQQSWVSLSGRSVANFNLGDFEAARRDAEAAMRIEPNHQSAMVLGDIAYSQQHDSAAARRYYLRAYDLGSRDDSLMERLRTVGVNDPDHASRH